MPGRRERLTIILLALLQSLLLYAGWRGQQEGWWPLTIEQVPVYWYTMFIALPLMMMLSLVRLDDARFWQHVGGLLLSLGGLAAWAAWQISGQPAVLARPVLLPFGISVSVGLYVLLPFLQARLVIGGWRTPYSELVRHAWRNGLTLGLAAVFVALGWGVLWLSARLFRLIGIDVLDILLAEELFVVSVTGTLFGVGTVIARARQPTVHTLLHILVGLFTGLLPVLSVVILVFVGSLLLNGVEQLWDGSRAIWSSTSVVLVLSALLAHQVLFLNAVYQDGLRPAPYPRLFRWMIQMALLALPVIAALALYALWLRIEQYGLTVERFWTAVAVGLLALHSLGYALIQLVPHRRWLGHLPRVNVAMAFVLIAVVVAGNTPLLDPHRLSADWQQQRLANLPEDEVEDADLRWLRFRTGRFGSPALAELRTSAGQTLAERIQRQLEADSPGDLVRPTMMADAPDALDIEPIPEPLQVTVPGSEPPLEETFREFLAADPATGRNCAGPEADCLVLRVDADQDGNDERLLCNLGLPSSLSCRMARRTQAGDWQWISTVGWPRDEAAEEALRAGDIRTVAPRWQSLQAGENGPVFHLYEPRRSGR